MPKSFIVFKNYFKLLGFENAVVKLAAAPRRFPNDIAIMLFTSGEK